uniref:Cytochrome c oxidase assembly factor 6 homolog isoform X1 n=1 Tax=Phascolarctos cinereus TaxID=38626 RepID=A0A6P5LCT2_PHACI|nr:cytochrome c oxidase assembly factor 6 homolog isoform X1 [Phascolarctos cinereus]
MTAPSMKERQVCWGARDDYWKCLDENTDDASKCKKFRSIFESSCPQQWRCYKGFMVGASWRHGRKALKAEGSGKVMFKVRLQKLNL